MLLVLVHMIVGLGGHPLPPGWGGCVTGCVCLGARFCAVSDPVGGVPGLLGVIGGVFMGGLRDPPSWVCSLCCRGV